MQKNLFYFYHHESVVQNFQLCHKTKKTFQNTDLEIYRTFLFLEREEIIQWVRIFLHFHLQNSIVEKMYSRNKLKILKCLFCIVVFCLLTYSTRIEAF